MVELDELSPDELRAVMDDLAARGVFVALAGARVDAPGGSGHLEMVRSGVTFDGRALATVGMRYTIPAKSAGRPCCPHLCTGTIVEGMPDITAGGRPVAVVGSRGQHFGACKGDTARIVEGYRRPYLPGTVPLGVETGH